MSNGSDILKLEVSNEKGFIDKVVDSETEIFFTVGDFVTVLSESNAPSVVVFNFDEILLDTGGPFC